MSVAKSDQAKNMLLQHLDDKNRPLKTLKSSDSIHVSSNGGSSQHEEHVCASALSMDDSEEEDTVVVNEGTEIDAALASVSITEDTVCEVENNDDEVEQEVEGDGA